MGSLFSRHAAAAAPPAPKPQKAGPGAKQSADRTMQPHVLRQAMGPTSFAVSPTRKVLADHLGKLEPGHQYAYLTGGKWSNHQLLQYMLEHTGPADVYATTWTITEEPVRVMQELLSSGHIRNLTLLTDHRIKSRAPQAWQLMQSLRATVHLSKCHAKITVAIGDVHALVAINSQNMTRNPRIEAGLVLFNREAAEFYRDSILSEIDTPQLAKVQIK